MLAVSGPFPLTSDQPPVAVVDPAMIASLNVAARRSGGDAAVSGPGTVNAAQRSLSVPRGADPDPPWKLDPARDPYALVGPRPAFEANVLDKERHLEAILARIELARSQSEMRRGTDPDIEAAKARAAAEAEAKARSEAAPPAGEDVATLEAQADAAEADLEAATRASEAEAMAALTRDLVAMPGAESQAA